MTKNEILARYAKGDNLKSIAAQAGVCYTVVRMVLITEGVPLRDCHRAVAIHAMLDKGMTTQEIADALGVKKDTIDSYTPYTKCSYSIGDKSDNALRIKQCRTRKAGERGAKK